MKKIKKLPLLILALILAVAATLCAIFGGGSKAAYADTYDPYKFEFTYYSVTYDIRTDRTMDVTLDLGVHYLGYRSTGIMYDIPVNAGDRVRKVTAYELNGKDGEEMHLVYDVKNEENNLLTVDMGDHSYKYGETHYYRVKYEYAITNPAKNEKNAIFLNAIGYGSQGEINDIYITLNLPDGFLKEDIKCYHGYSGNRENDPNCYEVSGNTITMHLDHLNSFQGVTFDIYYNAGVLSTKTDMTPYWVIIFACVLLGILFAVKFLRFNKDGLTPVTNVEAPDDMDPLVMGKLIDNRVDKSDVTSLIYYWANKGYLKINIENELDIELIRINQSLPSSAPRYQKRMYDKLFAKGDVVKIKSLTNSFYSTVESVTKEVNATNSKLYDKESLAAAVIFAILSGLFMSLTPIIMGLSGISMKFFLIAPLFVFVPVFIILALTQAVRYNKLKFKKSKLALMYAGVALLAAACVGLYILFVPSYVIEIVPKIILSAVGFATVMLSASLVSRTEEYTEKLNKIVGFRNFILYAEKDKLETMLEGNPEFYYQVLPYAIVLGVSDIWENKFAALTIAPPSWTTSTYHDRMFNFVVFNSVIRSTSTRMTTAFVSRPSSGSYSGGGSHGGSFGGHSGGGHGGGGFRGR